MLPTPSLVGSSSSSSQAMCVHVFWKSGFGGRPEARGWVFFGCRLSKSIFVCLTLLTLPLKKKVLLSHVVLQPQFTESHNPKYTASNTYPSRLNLTGPPQSHSSSLKYIQSILLIHSIHSTVSFPFSLPSSHFHSPFLSFSG